MTPRERFFAAVNGKKVDRIPVTTWVHFLSDHLPGIETARLHERFLKTYGWDLAKVMGDYRYPIPAGAETLDDGSALKRFEPLGLDDPSLAQQLICIDQLRTDMGADFPLLETGFDPYQAIIRNVGRDQVPNLWKHKAATLHALEAVCESTCRYVEAIRKRGIDGYFYATNAAIPEGFPRGMSVEIHETFVKPFDLRILKAAEGMVRVLHVHGTGLDLDRLKGYPFEVVNLSDRAAKNPSLAELRKWTDKCLMGGIDESGFPDASLGRLASEIDDAIAQAGRDRFILAPGCTLPSFSPKRSLDFVREYSRTA